VRSSASRLLIQASMRNAALKAASKSVGSFSRTRISNLTSSGARKK
jgi:hypothetical protein